MWHIVMIDKTTENSISKINVGSDVVICSDTFSLWTIMPSAHRRWRVLRRANRDAPGVHRAVS